MSQMTATARPLRAPRRGPTATPLRVMPTRFTATGNGAFATLCLVLLTVGLIALLLLNTALAQGSLVVGTLQRESTALTNSAANLNAEIAAASAGGALAAAAVKLGMVRSNERAYLNLATGTVSGTAYPATSYQALPIVTRATPPPPLTGSDQKLVGAAAASVLGVVAPLGPKVAPKADKKADKKAAPKADKKAASKKGSATPKTPAATTKAPATPRLTTKPSAARGASSQTPAIG
ncbi:hypothetical protein BA895_15840 [Humibacillus sp. DSM 29435]|uniref:hypothetical protein n=1 Tax=Humibacillus sp. DSM 29435 TaxID=1869167 RepID=UPI000871F106|nr:hypothetical protein [Humibacillus sp. DSM 29435]OFE17476.1 hypothetical protein BA895_15840 [Humibacillus sp. DSM 29435]